MVCTVILANLVFEKKRGTAKLVLVNRYRSAAQEGAHVCNRK